jgi:hypothetical protein
LNAGNAVIRTFVLARHHIHGAVPGVKQKNLLLPALFFIIANFLSAKLFILLIMFVKVKKISLPTSLPDGYPCDR